MNTIPFEAEAIVKDLKPVVTQGSKAISGRSTLPVLGMMLICVWDNGFLAVCSTNLEKKAQEIRQIARNVTRDFQICVTSQFSDWLKTCTPKSTVKLEFNPRLMVLTAYCDNATAHFKGICADEFPAVWNQD